MGWEHLDIEHYTRKILQNANYKEQRCVWPDVCACHGEVRARPIEREVCDLVALVQLQGFEVS